ncbi:acyl-CoA synthetase (NDP forming) [Bradyrhizobium sp. YR681]|uniref:acetate--CoA ligase family protein n=1 Tax=Bradyrhizobium sp. YR681 TaxID=1144344 RepID=UPI00026F5AAC|nr:acetate--CoA ligase family protein [Bradyrhizobium sp. YR681]EJN07257.1 acyl-CoA synthetase (NDP forming) [Bradyrhizobium sp. YR681]
MTSPGRLEPYRRAELKPLYDPGSVAIIGASPRPASFGARTAANLKGFFGGRSFLVNDKYDRIGDAPCYPSLRALPGIPDLAVVTTPAATVEPIIEACIAAGVPSVMLYASGFAEIGTHEAIETQNRIVRRAREANLRLLGPNCVGLLNYTSGARITFAAVPETRSLAPFAIGLVSQSGALGFALAQAIERGVSFSHVLTSGNSGDVDIADWIAALAEDPACAVIACAFEGVAHPLKMLAAAERAWDNDKPLVVFKLATGETGAAAALSHTGSLAGSNASWRALLERGGAVVVDNFEDLIETAAFFGKVCRPKAEGVAVLAGSGGAAIMGADSAEQHGVPLPQPEPRVRAVLEARIPPFGAPRNPCDVTAQVISDSESLMDCADALLSAPGYGALVYGCTYAYGPATERLPHLSALAGKHGKPICAVWLTQYLEGPGSQVIERDPNIAIFRSMDRCFAALAAWTARAERAAHLPVGFVVDAERKARAAALLPSQETVLGETETKALLAIYGIATSRDITVTRALDAVQAARAIGGKVAMKIDSPDIAHKSDAGGVLLSVEGDTAVREAYDQIMATCARAVPTAQLRGVIVQEMVPAGVEIIVGVNNDPLFGPMIVIGLGGVLTELLRDSVTALAPVDEYEALRLLARLRGVAILDGFRSSPPVDRSVLARTISRISALACAHRDRLRELDVNPLICRGESVVAVDGLAVIGPNA